MDALQVDDDLLRKQQEAYKVQGVDEDEQVTAQQLKKKRKQQSNADEVSISSFFQLDIYICIVTTESTERIDDLTASTY